MNESTVTAPARTVDLLVALDVGTLAAAKLLVSELGDACDFYKVGLELFTAEGPPVVSWLREQGKRVFLDLKLHDIPNTVHGAARSAAKMGASLVTAHASGGFEMMRAAVAGADEGSTHTGSHCGILGVTVLTSLDAHTLAVNWGRDIADPGDEVLRLAALAHAASAAGIVCSGREVARVRDAFGSQLGTLVPGIRLAGGAVHDQARPATPDSATRDGARWLVLGRVVTAAADPKQAMADIRDQVRVAQALS